MNFRYHTLTSGAAEHAGLGKRHSSHQKNKSFFIQKMSTYKLDDIIKDMKLLKPSHIKIDVDGHEFAILQGASNTLKSRNLKSIQLEVDTTSEDTKKINDYLSSFGFKLHQKNRHTKSTISDYVFINAQLKSR